MYLWLLTCSTVQESRLLAEPRTWRNQNMKIKLFVNNNNNKPKTKPKKQTKWLYFTDGSVLKNPPGNAGDVGSIQGLGRSPGEGNDNPLQYSCLENPMGKEGWRATVLRDTNSQILLKRLSIHAVISLVFLSPPGYYFSLTFNLCLDVLKCCRAPLGTLISFIFNFSVHFLQVTNL